MSRHDKQTVRKIFAECIYKTVCTVFDFADLTQRTVQRQFVIVLYSAIFQKFKYIILCDHEPTFLLLTTSNLRHRP